MTSILIFLKHACPWLWVAVERVNGWLFGLRYSSLADVAGRILRGRCINGYRFSLVTRGDLDGLSAFLLSQPQDSLVYFAPHRFDRNTLERLFRNRAFLLMKVTESGSGRMVGYFFLRCFFIGKAFHGLIVGSQARNCKVGTSMWALSQEICQACGLRMFATVSSNNVPSLSSARRGTNVRVVRHLSNDYLLIECTAKETCASNCLTVPSHL